MHARDLVPPPPDRPLGALGRSVVGGFLLATAGVGFADWTWPPVVPELAGSDAQTQRHREAEASVWDGTRMQLLDEHLARHSNVKAYGTPWYSGFLLTVLGESDPEALTGRDGWMFLERRARRPVADPDQTATVWARACRALDRQLRRQGSRLVTIPVPRRAVTCEAFLPDGYDPNGGLEDALHAALHDVGLEVVDLRPVFAPHAPEELFYRQDTHWSRAAQWLAAGAVVQALDIAATDDVVEDRLLPVVDGPNVQALIRYGGLQPDSAAQRFWQPTDWSPDPNPKDVQLRRSRGPEDAPLALIGTSFSVGEKFLTYIRVRGTEEVRNASRRGFRVWATLDSHLRDTTRLQDTILLELLLDHVDPTVRASATQRYRREFQFLTHLGRSDGPALFATSPLVYDADAYDVVLPAGRLLSSGDGACGLRLERPPGVTGKLRVECRAGGLRWSVTWHEGDATILLPLLSLDTDSAEHRWSMQGPGSRSVQASAARLVSEFDLVQRRPLPTVQDPGSTSPYEFLLPAAPLATQLALQVELDGSAGACRIELIAPDGEEVLGIAAGDLDAEAQAWIDLTPHAMRTWAKVRVTTERDMAGGVRAHLVPLGDD